VSELQPDAFFEISPFSLVADARTATCWAGRADVKARLEKICRGYNRRGDSSLDVIWANLGAGKTHALLHLTYMLSEEYADSMKTLIAFVEMPQNLRNFLGLYQRIIAALPLAEDSCWWLFRPYLIYRLQVGRAVKQQLFFDTVRENF